MPVSSVELTELSHPVGSVCVVCGVIAPRDVDNGFPKPKTNWFSAITLDVTVPLEKIQA